MSMTATYRWTHWTVVVVEKWPGRARVQEWFEMGMTYCRKPDT
jgi:hypothetical protein